VRRIEVRHGKRHRLIVAIEVHPVDPQYRVASPAAEVLDHELGDQAGGHALLGSRQWPGGAAVDQFDDRHPAAAAGRRKIVRAEQKLAHLQRQVHRGVAERRVVVQTDELRLGLTAAERGPVLLGFPEPADQDPDAGSPVQASTVPDRMEVADLALEVSATRGYWQQWHAKHGRTAVGLSGVDPLRFRGVVRYLEAYLAGEEPRRTVDSVASTPSFVRHCVEDVRAMYFEARLFTHPDESAAERQRWFWAQTEFGSFLRQLQRHMEQSDDEQTREAAYGIAR
jgi:hypothetical protein